MVKKIPMTLDKDGHVRIDDYYWLRERDNPEVIAYLNVENEHAEKEMAEAQPSEKGC
jgi:oligopeptidase B